MEEIFLKQLREKMNIRYKLLTFVFSHYALYIYERGIKKGFDWKN